MITNYQPLYPYLLLTLLALIVALLGTYRGGKQFCGWLTAIGALGALALDWSAPESAPWQGLIRFDAYSHAFNTVFLVALALVVIGAEAEQHKMVFGGEYCALLILSAMGLMLMGAANSLLPLYLGLELSTLSMVALAGIAKRERRSAEAALKMLILGSVASAVTLYGASIVYGVLGSVQYDAMIAAMPTYEQSPALWLGLLFVLGGLGFKIAAAPFHLWAPDVYEGAPSTVTAYLSTASKAGGFAALLRLLLLGVGTGTNLWQTLVIGLAVLSMILGNLIALSQTNLKRLLAYSGIAQAGYILVAVAGVPGTDWNMGVGAALMYLFLYAFTNIGGFLIAQEVADATGSDQISALRGLHRRSPALAFATLVVLFSLGGIPPLSGFVGKLYLFAAGWQGGQQALVLLGAITSVIALYYYLMVARQVYIADPADERRFPIARPLSVAISLCVIATLVIGIYPRPFVALGERAATSLHVPAQDLGKRTEAPEPLP
jgi:NADH-quinone oxidoreductase subunit N